MIVHYPRRRADHLKLGAYFLDLGGLLSELGCESLYLFLLLRHGCLLLINRCLQVLNFVIEHGLAIRLRAHARLRCATMRRIGGLSGAIDRDGRVKAKVVVIKIQSNYNNVGAVSVLLVGEDTTDEAGFGPGSVIVRDVADADRIVSSGVPGALPTKSPT